MKVTRKSGKFLWLGNRLVLDFVNTLAVVKNAVTDLLQSPADLLLWLAEGGLTEGDSSDLAKRLTDKELHAALALARTYRDLIRGSLADRGFKSPLSPSFLSLTNELLATPTRVSQLRPANRGKLALTQKWNFSSGEDLLRPVADSLADLLTAGDPSRIRRCMNPACILYFYDLSKNNSRNWCSLNICGNKLRVAAFRERHSSR